MQRQVEETALSTTNEQSGEVQAASLSAAAQREIEVRVMLAQRFPRVEDESFRKVASSLARPDFAAIAYYEMPAFGKGKNAKPIPVRSVHLAREMMRCWRNMSSGLIIVAEDQETATVRGFAWDMESNTFRFEDISVPKLVQKRQYDQDGNHTGTIWVKADANEFRRLCANMGARTERNSIFRLIGAHYVDAAVAIAKATCVAAARANLSTALKGLLVAFERIGIFLGEIEQYLGCKIAEATPEQITELEGIGRAIKAGEAKWSDYTRKDPEIINGNIELSQITKSADENRGHDRAAPQAPKEPEPPPTPQEAQAASKSSSFWE